MQRADVTAADRVLEQHAHREVERLGREVNELGSLVLELARRVRVLEADGSQGPEIASHFRPTSAFG